MDATAIQVLLTAFGSASPAAIFGLMWWLERSERRANAAVHAEDQKQWLEAVRSVQVAVASVKDLISTGTRRP